VFPFRVSGNGTIVLLKRTAASCEVADQYFARECGLLRLRGHECASSSFPSGWPSRLGSADRFGEASQR
jgi:hypothetical protein